MNLRIAAGVAVGTAAVAAVFVGGPSHPASAQGPVGNVQLVGVSIPSHLAAVAAEQSGTIVEMSVMDGDRVATGDVLFRLSTRLQQLEVDRLQAIVDSELEREQAAASLDHARKKAERMRQLSEKEISSQSTVLEVELESELARLSLGKVEFERTQRRNELLQAKERLAERTLKSPLDGIVTRRFKQLGESAEQLEPVVEVMSLNPLWVQFECPVAQESEFPRGGQVLVRPVIGDHEPRLATIVFASPQAAVAGHTFPVRASLPNEDYSWRSGLKMQIESVRAPQARPAGGK